MSLATQSKEEAAAAVKKAAKSVGDQIQTASEEAYRSVKTEAERLASQRRDGMAGYAFDLSDAIESASATLEERGRHTAAQFARRAAEEIDSLGGRVQGQDVGSLLHRVEDFAKERPALFLGGAFLLSFALIRYLGRGDGRPAPAIDAGASADTGAYV